MQVASFPSSLIDYLGFNTQNKQQPALGSPALWQAARWLVDYNSLSQQLQTDIQQHSPFVVSLQGQQLVGLGKNIQGAHQGIGISLLYFDRVSKN